MRLSIYSLQRTVFDGEAASLTLPTVSGEITVLDNHLPVVTLAAAGTLRYRLPGDHTTHALPLHSGVIEIRPGSEVVILTKED